MQYAETYRQKLTTAEEAVKVIQPGDWVDYSFTANQPVALDRALAARMAAEPDLTNLNFRGGIALWPPAVTQLPDAADRITWNSWHVSGIERRLFPQGIGYYHILRYSEMPRYYRENIRHVNVAMFQVAPMDAFGNFNFGLTPSHLRAICDVADTIIVEVNRNMPYVHGGHDMSVHVDEVSMIVEADNPIGQLPSGAPSEVDTAVAKLILPEIPNGACLQLGIGGMPNAVGALIAQSDLKDLGVHSEMYVDAFVDIAMAGKITGKYKSLDHGRQVFTFAAGTQKLYDYMNNNPAIMGAPVDYVNDTSVIAQLDNFISINNTVEVDLFGQVASETAGTRHISGAGGQLDFVLGAYRSKGGKSFICCSSTVKNKKDGTVKSRITPTLTPGGIVTATRANIQYLVTEYGMVNLKGTTTWQRAEAIISVAHPDFRNELIAEAEKMHIWKRSNKR